MKMTAVATCNQRLQPNKFGSQQAGYFNTVPRPYSSALTTVLFRALRLFSLPPLFVRVLSMMWRVCMLMALVCLDIVAAFRPPSLGIAQSVFSPLGRLQMRRAAKKVVLCCVA